MKLQPLRIEAGWQVSYNQLYEIDPVPGLENYFEGSSLLVLRNDARLKLIDVEWRPERDLNGEYRLTVLNFVENYNAKTNDYDHNPIWEHPFLAFNTRSRSDLVEKLEELMRTLPVHKDPRMLLRRGIVDELSESYRVELLENGISVDLIGKVLSNGSSKIQNHILEHDDITWEIASLFAENGITKKVKNKALRILNSKRK